LTLVDRSAPGVRITRLVNERAPNGEPLDLAGRILAFTYEDAEKKADQVSLQLDNFDLALFDRAELVGGATLEVSWGYPGNMAPPRRVVVKKLKGFQTLTIEGQATSVLMNREAKTRAWQNKSRADVVRQIAAEHGYEGELLDVEDTGEVLGTIHQSAETDARFLRRLAAREGYESFVDDTGLHWRSRNQAKAPTHVLTWFSDPGRGDILSVSVESDLARRTGRVEVRGRDPLTKTTIGSRATSATVERATLGDVSEGVDPETGATSHHERTATTSVHSTSAPTPAAAARESAARFRSAERATVKLALQVVGDPTLRAKQVIEVRGISSLLSGKYYVTDAKHVLSSSGYVVDLKLTRDGTGARRGAGPSTRGQAQGGEPNRATPATGGTLTELERVDRETGRTVVEYRRDGNVVGVDDPEAGVSRMYEPRRP
jgi:phage protein D